MKSEELLEELVLRKSYTASDEIRLNKAHDNSG